MNGPTADRPIKIPMEGFFEDPEMLAPSRVTMERRDDGSFVLRSPEPIAPHARAIGEWLEHWAEVTPRAIFLAERVGDDWRKLTYAAVRAEVGSIAQSLIDLGLLTGTERKPIVVLSDNSIDHALLALASMHIGLPIASVSPAYSRVVRDYSRLSAILDALDPGLIYAADAEVYKAALSAVKPTCPAVFSKNANVWSGSVQFDRLLRTPETSAVRDAFLRITPETHAKYLLTSGSTGVPKVVINTHGMLCANQQMIAQCWRFVSKLKPVVVDWLPWSHTFGSNHNFNLVLRNGGELYIDEGRPMPGLIEKTARNIADVGPNMYFNVPRGFDMLLPFLETDAALAQKFFSRLTLLFYAGAALSQTSWERLEAVAARVRNEPLFFASEWGSTETSPVITSVHFRIPRAGNIGIPVPGMELKFVPNSGRFEMRVRGPSVFPGYRNRPEKTTEAFDDEGFYKIGDAGSLVDLNHPESGVAFNGRVAEDFKLTTGVWVSVGTLRVKAVAAFAPYAQDIVITGHDRDEAGLMIFPSPALHALIGDASKTMDSASLAAHPDVRAIVETGLATLAGDGAGSSQRATRALILSEAPSIDAGEITDKGYINQRAVLTRRATEVEWLYSDPLHPAVVIHSSSSEVISYEKT